VGRNRDHNEDNHLIFPLAGSDSDHKSGEVSVLSIKEPGLLLAVADGMGGHLGGEVASSKCVEILAKEIVLKVKEAGTSHPDLSAALRLAVEATHAAVFAFAQDYAHRQTMGTTLTAALVCGAQAHVAQVGDSRAYLFRQGKITQETEDQTIGNQLAKRGADPAMLSEQIRESLAQAVGAQSEVNVVITSVDLEPHDLLLLCSDGLYKVVSAEEFVGILSRETSLAEKARQLIARANENGGPDNITVILAEISSAGPAE
jgi:serine/threonine protein phosphatase PrpC